jgi:hypothetical protein
VDAVDQDDRVLEGVSLLSMAVLLRKQWAVNERLPFPLAQLQLALIAPPEKGKFLNSLFRSRSFWIALGVVFAIHSTNALYQYFPRHVPQLPLTYDLSGVLSNEPYSFLHWNIKRATIFFTLVGVTYFIQSRLAFSMWSIFWVLQLISVQQRTMQREIVAQAWEDQHLGSGIAFVIGILWIGRHHWAQVLRHTFIGRNADERRRGVDSYRKWFIALLLGTAVMIGFVIAAGAQWWVAAIFVGTIFLSHFVVARIVAETGIPFIRFMASPLQIYNVVPATAFTGKDVFLLSTSQTVGVWGTREGLVPYAMHGMRINDGTERPAGIKVLAALMGWALLVSFVVSVCSSLWSYYTHSYPLNQGANQTINVEGTENKPNATIVQMMRRHSEGKWPPVRHDPYLNYTIGAVTTGLLQAAALRWNWWPFMPVGYLVGTTWYMQVAWWSIFLGWLAKVLIVRFGGASLYIAARPFFVGIIFGEGLAAGVWLLINLSLALQGIEYKSIIVLPT